MAQVSCVRILHPRSGRPRAGGALEVPDRDICFSCTCKELCSSDYVLCRVDFEDFPELTPFLGYVVKEMCSLNQMDDSHMTILECPVSLIDFTPKNTGISTSLLFPHKLQDQDKS